MTASYQIKRRVGTAGVPASLSEGELAFQDPGGGPASLYVGTTPAAVLTLVNASRQVEIAGAQTITGVKTIAVGNLKITGGTNTYVLTTDGSGNLSWTAKGGFPDAPSDSVHYVRQNAAWVSGDAIYAPLASPVFTGDPHAPTPAVGDNDTSIATTAFVQSTITGNVSGTYVRWILYTGPPQSFLKEDMTRDGDWTMVANKNTSDRPAPQLTGTEEDLLPPWAPTAQSARAGYTVLNEWTLSQSGFIEQYGVDVVTQNVGATHAVTLAVNGTAQDTFTAVPSNAGTYMHDITPLLCASGAVVRVTLQVTQISNNLMYWFQDIGLFATAPTYTSLAQGSKDGGAMTTTAYGCHAIFVPGAKSPDWDVVAFGGAVGAAPTGGLPDAPEDGFYYGRQNAAWAQVLPLAGGTMTGAITLPADPTTALQAATKQYVDNIPVFTSTAKGEVPASGGGTTNFLRADGTFAAPPTGTGGGNVSSVGTPTNGQWAQWTGATTIQGIATASAPWVQKAGDTMTGALTLPGNPASALQAAPKQYVDLRVKSVNHVLFTSSGTYTPSAGLIAAIVIVIGSAGAGGGASTTVATSINMGGGGGAGAITRGVLSAAQIGASQAVTIGAVAVGVAGAAGNNGAASSFGTLLTAGGGSGGGVSTSAGAVGAPGGGGAAGTATNGFSSPGGSGFSGLINTSASGVTLYFVGGRGADGPFGGGVSLASFATANGPTATAYGAGGGGGSVNQQVGSAFGGNGGPGLVSIIEFIGG